MTLFPSSTHVGRMKAEPTATLHVLPTLWQIVFAFYGVAIVLDSTYDAKV